MLIVNINVYLTSFKKAGIKNNGGRQVLTVAKAYAYD
jgi:hypothetical protein